MFEGLKNMGEMMKLMGQLPRMQAQMAEMQEKMRNQRLVGEAGAGMVRVTVSGLSEVISVQIDPEVLKDADSVGPLVVAATNTALMKAKQTMAEASAQAMGIPMPPGMQMP
jgi:nucleoid-associated protein EbfC